MERGQMMSLDQSPAPLGSTPGGYLVPSPPPLSSHRPLPPPPVATPTPVNVGGAGEEDVYEN